MKLNHTHLPASGESGDDLVATWDGSPLYKIEIIQPEDQDVYCFKIIKYEGGKTYAARLEWEELRPYGAFNLAELLVTGLAEAQFGVLRHLASQLHELGIYPSVGGGP